MSRIDRQDLLREIEDSVADFKLTALLGPRRSGKTSLIQALEVPEENYLNLDDPLVQARLEDPEEVLGDLRGLVVIDEFQRQADLLPALFEMVKGWGGPSRFLLVGSTSLDLMKGYDEELVEEINVIRMGGLSCRELGAGVRDPLWLRGGYPESFHAGTDAGSREWRRAYVATFLRRALPGLGIDVPPERLRRLWVEAARRHGDTWNSSAVAASLGVSHPTARSYLDLLTKTFMLRQLRPFAGKGKKRTVKAPRVFLRDSGLLHELLEIGSMEEMIKSPWYEPSWKGFAIEQLASLLRLGEDEMFFWATHGGAEIDLVIERDGKRFGFDFRLSGKPSGTHSVTIAKADLDLECVYLVHPGEQSFPFKDGIEVMGFAGLAEFKLP